MFDSLRSYSDHELLTNTDAIIVHERKLTLKLLVHLHEIERRRLFLSLGYGSMFDYCTTHLRLSEPSAVRRIRTARCLARFPGLHDLLESGEVNLTTVSMVARILSPGNVDALLARIRGKSKREVEAIVAEHEPRATVPPDRVRTVVVPVLTARQSQLLASRESLTVSGDGKQSSTREGEGDEHHRVGDSEESPAAAVFFEETATFERRALVQFSARETVMSKLERVRSIASHRLPGNASLEQVIEFLGDYFIAREDPALRHARREGRNQNENGEHIGRQERSKSSRKASRSIPARVRDQVFVRDKQRCTFVSSGGKRCDSTHVLQVDHVRPFARGGASTLDNLRLLCAHHNRLEARRLMGCPGPPG